MIPQANRPIHDLLHAIAVGETSSSAPAAARWPSRLAASEEGLVSWATLVAVAFFVVLSSLVANVGITVTEKVETQNAADSVAYSSAVWSARGMNAVTASNHLIGELTALYVIHHGIGGKVLDDGDEKETELQNNLLRVAYYSAWLPSQATVPVYEEAFNTCLPNPKGEAMLYDAKLRIKEILTMAYTVHGAAAVIALLPIPGIQQAAIAVEWAAYAVELEMDREYRFLNIVEQVAISLKGVKKGIPTVLKAIRGYQQTVVTGMPAMALLAASEVGSRNHVVGRIGYAGLPKGFLPVRREPKSGLGDSVVERRSQLMRATYPWVCHWRGPIQTLLFAGATLSGAAKSYEKWTNTYSLSKCQEFRDDHGMRLYVLDGLDLPDVDKSNEPWNKADGNEQADKLFCMLGAARTEIPPMLVSGAFYRQANPEGMVCFSQAMIYSANPQQRPGAAGGSQPRAGWDTLAWGNTVPEWKQTGGSFPPFNRPRPIIRLNWQARLTPITQTQISVSGPRLADPGMLKTLLLLDPANTSLLMTH